MHEGLGTKAPNTGHSRIIRDESRKPSGDFRRVLETMAAAAPDDLVRRADVKIQAIDQRIDMLSADPLPPIFHGRIAALVTDYDALGRPVKSWVIVTVFG